jgi:hypothetical protein
MDTQGNQASAHQTKKKFWTEYTATEKMTAINILFVALYSLLTAALVWIASLQYKGLTTDERPWIRLIAENPQINSPSFTITTHALNSGKTPAKSFSAVFFIEVVKNGEDPRLNEDRAPTAQSTTGVAFPNIPVDTPVSYTFTQSEFQDFKDRRAFFILYAKMTYSDFFRIAHWTKHCQFFAIPPGGYTAKKCTDYNDIDNN